MLQINDVCYKRENIDKNNKISTTKIKTCDAKWSEINLIGATKIKVYARTKCNVCKIDNDNSDNVENNNNSNNNSIKVTTNNNIENATTNEQQDGILWTNK